MARGKGYYTTPVLLNKGGLSGECEEFTTCSSEIDHQTAFYTQSGGLSQRKTGALYNKIWTNYRNGKINA
jgi:hypothetical protein